MSDDTLDESGGPMSPVLVGSVTSNIKRVMSPLEASSPAPAVETHLQYKRGDTGEMLNIDRVEADDLPAL